MKKYLIISFLFFLSTMGYAQKITLKSGNLNFFKTEKTIAIQFTYENMKVGKMTETDYVNKKIQEKNDKEPGSGDAWFNAWNSDRTERFEPKFIELFNKNMEEKSLAAIGEGGNLLMKINTDFVEPGFNVGVARKNASIDLTISFIEKSSGETLAVITVAKTSANNFWGTDMDVAYRIQENYAKGGRELAQFIIKQLKVKE